MAARRSDALIALSVAGIAIAGYLSFVAFDADAEVFCTGVGDCNRVQESQYARVAGIPVAALGLAMYAVLLALTLARRLGLRPFGSTTARVLPAWIFALAFAGMLYSAYLTYLELFVINAICEWCVVSAIVVTAITVLAWPDVRSAAGDAQGDARSDWP